MSYNAITPKANHEMQTFALNMEMKTIWRSQITEISWHIVRASKNIQRTCTAWDACDVNRITTQDNNSTYLCGDKPSEPRNASKSETRGRERREKKKGTSQSQSSHHLKRGNERMGEISRRIKISHTDQSPPITPVSSDLVSDARVWSVESDKVGESSMKRTI